MEQLQEGADTGGSKPPLVTKGGQKADTPSIETTAIDTTKKAIHVINVKRTLLDLLTASPEEVAIAIDAAVGALPRMRGPLRALALITERARGITRYLNIPAPPGQMPEITARALFACPAYLPLIDRGARGASDGTLLRVRPATAIRAVHIDGSMVAVAENEPIDLLGIIVDPARFAELILDAYGGGTNRGLASYADTGTFAPQVLGAVGFRYFPQPEAAPEIIDQNAVGPGTKPARGSRTAFRADTTKAEQEAETETKPTPATPTANILAPGRLRKDLERRGFSVYLTPDREGAAAIVSGLLAKAHASAAFYQGCAVAYAANALAAARGGKGPSKLLALVGHTPGTLGESIVGKEATAPLKTLPGLPPLSEEKLKYLMTRLSKTRPIAADNPDTYVYELSPLFDLFRVGAFDIYLYVLAEGRESPTLDTFLERETMAYARETHLRRLQTAAVLATSLARQYVIIIEDKLGAARLAQVMEALRLAAGQAVRVQGEPWVLTKLAAPLVQLEDPSVLLSHLTQKERALVQTEYENRKVEWESQVGNKCPHVKLAKRLRAAPSTQDAEDILAELSTYFVEPRKKGRGDPTDALRDGISAAQDFVGRDEREADASAQSQWIRCKNCGFRVICPHVRELIRLDARGASYEEKRTRLFRYRVRYSPQAADGEAETYTYFCRICSERLAEFIEEDRSAELLGRYGDLDTGLRGAIWVEAMTAAAAVRFPAPTDPKQFASVVTDSVYQLVMAAEEATTKRAHGRAKRAALPSADEEGEVLDPKLRLSAVLFVYAYILNLIQSSETSRKKSQDVGFEGVKPGAKISVFADRILTHIAESRKGLLSQIEGITSEFIAAKFKEAFRLVRGDSGDLRLRPVDAEEELANQTVIIDPIYHYAATTARIAGDLPIGQSSTPALMQKEFETVMGDSLPNIVKKSREYAKLPALASLYSKKLVVEVPADTTLEFLYKDPRVNLYARLYQPKRTAADEVAVKKFYALAGATGAGEVVGGRDEPRPHRGAKPRERSETSKLSLLRSDPRLAEAEHGYHIETYRLFLQYTTAVTNQAAWDQYMAGLKKVKAAADGYYMVKAVSTLKTYYNFGFKESRQFQQIDIPVTLVYDENGENHKWNTLIFGDPKGTLIEIKTNPKDKNDKSVMKAIEKGSLEGMSLIDLKCVVCGVRQTETDKLNPEKALRSLRITAEIVSFFSFYETRCPEGGLHSFSGSKCQKCGMAETLSADPKSRTLRNSEARSYYDKYERVFTKERRDITEPPSMPTTRPMAESKPDDALAQWAAGWKHSYGEIVKVAEATEMTPSTIEAIGDMELRDYADIKEGKGGRPPPVAVDDPRILAADSDVRLFIAEYSILQSAYRLPRLPPHLADILAKLNFPRHEFESLKTLPDVYDRYKERLDALMKARSPADVLKFIIEKLCTMTLTLLGQDKTTPLGAVASAFALYEFRSILRSEKLLSKPQSFNFSIFWETPDEQDIPDDVGDDGEDTFQDVDAAAGEDGAAAENIGSYENMDYEENEGDDNAPEVDFQS